MKKLAVIAFALVVAASMAMAGALNQFKAGDISFSVFDKDGSTPVQSASIKALDAASGEVVAEVVADDLGQAVLALDAGRYLLNVSDINLAVFDVDAAEGISLCRVIMPDAALLAGGQDDENNEGGASVGGSIVWPVVGAVVAAAVIVGATWAIIENNDDDDHHDSKEVAPATTPVVYPKKAKKASSSSSST